MIQFGRKKQRKKIRKRQHKKVWHHRYRQHKKMITMLAFLTGIVLFLIGAVVLAKLTFLSSKQIISVVTFAPESIEVYDDPEIYTRIRKEVEGENFYLLKRNKRDSFVKELQQDFPLISSLSLEQSDTHRAYVTLGFYDPTLVFRSPSGFTAVYNEILFPLTSGNSLGRETLTIDIPRYTSGYTSLHGILYEIDEDKLVEQITTIKDTLGSNHITEIVYLPGGRKLFIAYKSKLVYFHLDQEINRQLAKLVDVENRFDGFQNISSIDVGSIDDVIVR